MLLYQVLQNNQPLIILTKLLVKQLIELMRLKLKMMISDLIWQKVVEV